MAENPHIQESPKASDGALALPPAISNLKSRLDPANFKCVQDAYIIASDAEKKLLQELLVRNADEIDACLDSPTELQGLLNKVILETKVATADMKLAEKNATKLLVEAKSEVVEAKSEVVEAKSEVVEAKKEEVETKNEAVGTEVMVTKIETTAETTADRLEKADWEKSETMKKSSNERTEERLQLARKQLVDAYKIFGGKDAFDAKFASQMPRWRADATQAVEIAIGIQEKKDGVHLSPEERETRIQISMIATNRDDIAQGLTGEDLKKFKDIVGQLNKSADDLGIPVTQSISTLHGYTVDEKNQIRTELIGLQPGDRVTRTGSEFRYGDQVVDISTRPPTRFIERDGLRVQTSLTREVPQENTQLIGALRSEKSTLEKNVSSDADSLKKVWEKLLSKNCSLDTTDPEKFRSGATELRNGLVTLFTEQFKKWEIQEGSADEMAAKRILKMVDTEAVEVTAKNIERIETINTEIVSLEERRKTKTEAYQETIQVQDTAARENLAHLSYLNLDTLGQNGIDFIIERVNEERTIRKEVPLALEKKFTLEDKWDLTRTLQRLVGKDAKIFTKEVPPTLLADANIAERLRASGVLTSLNEFNKTEAEKVLKTKE